MGIGRIFLLLAGAVRVLGSLVAQAPAIYFQKNRAVSVFQTGLRGQGLDEQAVRVLAEEYRQLGDLKNWVSRAR